MWTWQTEEEKSREYAAKRFPETVCKNGKTRDSLSAFVFHFEINRTGHFATTDRCELQGRRLNCLNWKVEGTTGCGLRIVVLFYSSTTIFYPFPFRSRTVCFSIRSFSCVTKTHQDNGCQCRGTGGQGDSHLCLVFAVRN